MPNKLRDLTGQRFNMLQVIQLDLEKSTPKRKYWKCKCDCGNIKSIRSDVLTSKTKPVQSCGCKTIEALQNTIHYIDLTGQKFGKWTALYPIPKKYDANGRIYWHCKCDCGNESDVSGFDLRSGRSNSCGCLRSLGEVKIADILNKANIPFVKEKQFDTCIFSKKNTKPRFDFYVDNKYLIEYDGRQHFQADKTKNTWNTEENLAITKERDAYKNQWCKENNIPLIRIPYTQYDNLCLEDLLLQTSKFKYMF